MTKNNAVGDEQDDDYSQRQYDHLTRRRALKSLCAAGALGVGSGVAAADYTAPDGGSSSADLAVYVFRDDDMGDDSWGEYVNSFCRNLPDFHDEYINIDADYYEFFNLRVPFKDYLNDDSKDKKDAFPDWVWDTDADRVQAGVVLAAGKKPLGKSFAGEPVFYVNNLVDIPVVPDVKTPHRYRIPMLMHETGHKLSGDGPTGDHGNGEQYQDGRTIKISAMAAGYTFNKLDNSQMPYENCGYDTWMQTTQLGDIKPYNAYSRCSVRAIFQNIGEGDHPPFNSYYVFEGPTNGTDWNPPLL